MSPVIGSSRFPACTACTVAGPRCKTYGQGFLPALQIDEQDALDRLLEKDTAEAAATLCQDEGVSAAKVCLCSTLGAVQ